MDDNLILQLKISLNDITPAIWRRIQIPGIYNFWDLHAAIQNAMGWQNCHLHEFLVTDPKSGAPVKIGVPDMDLDHRPLLPSWEVPVNWFLRPEKPWATYIYDFGDHWIHTLMLEEVLPMDPKQEYPVCLAGERACPPEDCGGVPGYEILLLTLFDPHHEEHRAKKEWVGETFDPAAFDSSSVRFEKPGKPSYLS